LVVGTFLTLDGVMQAPGGPNEDRDGGFRHGGWLVPYFDEQIVDVMTEWTEVPVFGSPPAQGHAVVRPSAYGLVTDGGARIGVVRTPQGRFLPGGGIERGEAPHQTVAREVLEECGLDVSVGSWGWRAVDFVYSPTERTHFEKRSTFVDARPLGPRTTARELDHELVWLPPQEAMASLAHPSHRWAVAQWVGLNAPGKGVRCARPWRRRRFE
jgi:8-oxo-dGTP diphosphatase